jgi:glycosyltransferase involved in cell wall biosynthesis
VLALADDPCHIGKPKPGSSSRIACKRASFRWRFASPRCRLTRGARLRYPGRPTLGRFPGCLQPPRPDRASERRAIAGHSRVSRAAGHPQSERRALYFSRVKRVIIWRDVVLPNSETFIANQMRAMQRWNPVIAGRCGLSNNLGVVPAFTLQHRRAIVDRFATRTHEYVGTTIRLHRHFAKANVVHAHFGPDAAGIVTAAQLARTPLVTTFHGYDITVSSAPAGYRKLFRCSSRLIAVSRFISDQLVAAGAPSDKVTVLPIGIPLPPNFRPPERRDGVLFVGRLVEKKGCADLLRAVAALPDRPLVTVIGDGPLHQELRALAEELRLRVAFVGARPPEVVARAMSRCAAFCVPSKTAANGDREGMGMVFLEAAAHSTPTVAYRSGGVPEAVVHGETGLLACEGDIPELARCLSAVLSDGGLARRLGEAGRARVTTEFDITVCTRRLESLYDEVAGEEPLTGRQGGAHGHGE